MVEPQDDSLGIFEGEADDQDPEVVEGMRRLAELRAAEGEIPDLR